MNSIQQVTQKVIQVYQGKEPFAKNTDYTQ